MDRNTTLCLACSSSLPPLKGISNSSSSSCSRANLTLNSIYITNCCHRPICPSCIASNPRLARYDPCLACLGGVGVVASGSGSRSPAMDGTGKGKAQMSLGIDLNFNLDGAVRDEDTFVLGDDDEDDDVDNQEEGQLRRSAPPPYEPVPSDVSLSNRNGNGDPSVSANETGSSSVSSPQAEQKSSASEGTNAPVTVLDGTRTIPYKYYINKRDTLQGIALRFGLDGHEICRLNNLPPSVIRTTPHLLHTRAFLLLPPTAKPHASLTLSAPEEKGREEKLVRERAEKKLQTLTKEVDWRVAKAYVALADDPQEQEVFVAKRKEVQAAAGQASLARRSRRLEALAVERYLEDEEWEAEERRAGRGVQVLGLPLKKDEKIQGKSKMGWW